MRPGEAGSDPPGAASARRPRAASRVKLWLRKATESRPGHDVASRCSAPTRSAVAATATQMPPPCRSAASPGAPPPPPGVSVAGAGLDPFRSSSSAASTIERSRSCRVAKWFALMRQTAASISSHLEQLISSDRVISSDIGPSRVISGDLGRSRPTSAEAAASAAAWPRRRRPPPGRRPRRRSSRREARGAGSARPPARPT